MNDVNKEAEQEVAKLGAKPVSLASMASEVEHIITSLPNGAIVKACYIVENQHC